MRGNLVRIASLLDGNRVSHDAAKAVTLQVSFSGIHFRHYSTDRQALRLDALGGIMRYFDRDFNLIRLRMILTRAVQPLPPSRITLRPSNDTPPVSCRD